MLKLFRKKPQAEEEKPPSDRPKEVQQILDEQVNASLKEFNKSHQGLLISAFSGGLEVGFSLLLMGTIYSLFAADMTNEALKMSLALCYPIGFIFVIIGRSELFTEHTALAMLPALKGSVKIKELFIFWALVYIGNLLGGYVFGFLIVNIGPDVGFLSLDSLHHFAEELTHHDWDTIFLSALMAGWMMGLLGWLVTSSQETISRIFLVILITAIIGLAGLHHCIVGSIEVFSGLISSEDITMMDYLKFQFWATLGNIIGGAVFVAILKYSHVRFATD